MTEALAEEEIRVIACGTGMPSARISQASACFLMELGNGDKFIFDLGSGSMRNINSLMIPSEYLTKVFLSHLHTDHWGDLSNLWAGGWTAGRPVPLVPPRRSTANARIFPVCASVIFASKPAWLSRT